MKLIYQTESEFNTIKVFEDDNGKYLLRLNEGTEIHSIYDSDKILLEPELDHYWNFLNLFPLMHGNAKKILMLGIGGGTALRQMTQFFPDAEIHGVEIDDQIVDVAIKYFNMTSPNIKVHVEDGLKYIQETKEKFDIIILDAFVGGNLSPRFLRATVFEDLKKILNPKGIVVGNYLQTRTLHYLITKAFKTAFKRVYKMQIEDCYNNIMYGSDEDYPQVTHHNKKMEVLIEYFNKKVRKV